MFLLGVAVQVRFASVKHACRQPGCQGRLDVDGIEWGLLCKTEALCAWSRAALGLIKQDSDRWHTVVDTFQGCHPAVQSTQRSEIQVAAERHGQI